LLDRETLDPLDRESIDRVRNEARRDLLRLRRVR
jgi:hypothetical protein